MCKTIFFILLFMSLNAFGVVGGIKDTRRGVCRVMKNVGNESGVQECPDGSTCCFTDKANSMELYLFLMNQA